MTYLLYSIYYKNLNSIAGKCILLIAAGCKGINFKEKIHCLLSTLIIFLLIIFLRFHHEKVNESSGVS